MARIPAALLACLTAGGAAALAYDWRPQPEEAALMLVVSHPDDEVYNFSEVIPYCSVVRKLPVVVICVTCASTNREERMQCACSTWGRARPRSRGTPASCR